LATRFKPNWPPTLAGIDASAVAPIAPIVFPPDVRVGPVTVITYPEPALVDAAIWEVAVDVVVGEKSGSVIPPAVAVEQSGRPAVVLTVSPVQKTKDSGM
jgi:hypothetical protein